MWTKRLWNIPDDHYLLPHLGVGAQYILGAVVDNGRQKDFEKIVEHVA